jgi:hypothetical protein
MVVVGQHVPDGSRWRFYEQPSYTHSHTHAALQQTDRERQTQTDRQSDAHTTHRLYQTCPPYFATHTGTDTDTDTHTHTQNGLHAEFSHK